jgi:hypothetical protein
MKSLLLKLALVAVIALQFSCCGDRNSSWYTLEFPETPQSWVRLLGEPHWRIEWFDPGGQKQSKDILSGTVTEVDIPVTWTNAVAAYPWWPDYNLIPGLFKPAGALFPHDISANRLHLTWEAGVDAVFYFELAYANSQDIKKIPANFDWIRFRELFKSEVLNEAVCKDPWLVNWRYVAEKTISSNFDRRRLVPQTVESVSFQFTARRWYGTSPFSEPLVFIKDEPLVFKAISGINVWISGEGILRCNGKVSFFTPFK